MSFIVIVIFILILILIDFLIVTVNYFKMLLAVLLLVPPCLSQRWMLLGGYTGFEGEVDAGATAQVLLVPVIAMVMILDKNLGRVEKNCPF